jgi:hypothetical protein
MKADGDAPPVRAGTMVIHTTSSWTCFWPCAACRQVKPASLVCACRALDACVSESTALYAPGGPGPVFIKVCASRLLCASCAKPQAISTYIDLLSSPNTDAQDFARLFLDMFRLLCGSLGGVHLACCAMHASKGNASACPGMSGLAWLCRELSGASGPRASAVQARSCA